MNSYRRAVLAATVLLTLLWIGCGETFRPVITPIPQPGGDPSSQRLALVVNQSSGGVGSISHYNVSGDTASVLHDVGTGPVHAGLLPPTGNRTYAANRDSDSVSSYVTFLTSSTVRTISLPAGSAPVFVHTNVINRMYVAESGTDRVGVIDVTNDLLIAEVVLPAGSTPVALAGTPNGAKLYSINQGNGTVTVIANIDNSILTTIPVGNTPVWAAMSSDGARLYVANRGDGTVNVIDTATDTVATTIPVGTTPRFLRFDPRLLRVYVANAGSDDVNIINSDTASPNFHTVVTVPVGTAPTSIAPLPDGTRAYVANSGCTDVILLTGCAGTTVSVIDTNSNTVTRTVTVGTGPVSLDASSNSARVFVANQTSQTISDIQTTNDTVVQTFSAPKVDPVCTDTSTVTCARQTPAFVVTTP